MALNLNPNSLHEAAQKLQQEQAKNARKSTAKRTATKGANKQSAPKTDTTKVENGAKYLISASSKKAIEGYLLGRGDMAAKMAREDKSIDKCCEFIYSSILKKARKMANGKQYVGVCPPDSEVFGLAVHYYDESNEALEKELKGE